MFLVRLPFRFLGFIVRNWLSIAILFAVYALFRFTGWSEYFNEIFGLDLAQEHLWVAAIKLIALAWLISFLKQFNLDAKVVFLGLVAIIVLAAIGRETVILTAPATALSLFIPKDMWGITFFAILVIYRLGGSFAPVEEAVEED